MTNIKKITRSYVALLNITCTISKLFGVFSPKTSSSFR